MVLNPYYYSVLLSFLSCILLPKAVLAQSSSTTTLTPPAENNKSVAVAPKKPLRDRLREKVELSYYGIYSGSELNGHWGKTVDIDNNENQLNMFHIVRSGYRITPTTSVGLVTRFSQDFTMRRGNEVIQNHSYELLNPRFYLRERNLVDNSWINLMLEGFAELPTTETNRLNKMTTTIGSAQGITFKQPIKALSLSLFAGQQFRIYRVNSNQKNLILAFYPYINYTLNDTWGFQTYAQITRFQRQEMPFHDTRAARDDYFRFGPTINPADWFQVYLGMQMFLARPQLNTSTLAFEISAGL